SIPSFARRSMLGVLLTFEPYALMAWEAWSSVNTNRMLGWGGLVSAHTRPGASTTSNSGNRRDIRLALLRDSGCRDAMTSREGWHCESACLTMFDCPSPSRSAPGEDRAMSKFAWYGVLVGCLGLVASASEKEKESQATLRYSRDLLLA